MIRREASDSIDVNDEIDIENIPSEEDDKDIDIAPFKIITYGADMTLEVLSNKLREQEIIVPPFQRKYVWPPKKASKLIESFLLGLPVPQIFLYREEKTQRLLVVDGQQRLKTIQYFLNGKFEDGTFFYLRDVKPKWEGKTYDALDEVDKRRLKNSILRTTIFEQTDPKDDKSIFEIFERLNTGGMPLTQQEIRNCVIHGVINGFLEELNKYSNWRNLLGKPQPDGRMRDIEMILRFLALHQNWETYEKPMKEFITKFMQEKKDITLEDQGRYSKIFKDAVDVIYSQIGPSAFRVKAGVNVAVFDSLTVGVSLRGTKMINLDKKYKQLKENKSYLDYISQHTTDIDSVKGRIKLVLQVLSE